MSPFTTDPSVTLQFTSFRSFERDSDERLIKKNDKTLIKYVHTLLYSLRSTDCERNDLTVDIEKKFVYNVSLWKPLLKYKKNEKSM